MLNQQQRTQLLRIARSSIEAVLAGERANLEAPGDEALLRPAGAFVTLTVRGSLRGCIGTIEAIEPLWQSVANNAVNAAFRDPRFPPLREPEVPHLEVEISVMSPIVPVASVDEIAVGRDGLIVRSGRHGGLLLPQVATEYGWDRDTFLGQTCVKAGLPPDAWRRPGTRIERFSAEVFGESGAEK